MAALALRLRDLAADSLADAQVYRDLIDLSLAKKPKDDAKLRIIGAGFSRTATLSMYAALMELGYKTYHGIELTFNTEVCDKWMRVLKHDLAKGNTEGVDWMEVTRGFEAGVDMPFADYWLELSRVFPDAKIIYTHRDGQKWIESFKTAIIGPMTGSIWFRMATYWFPKEHKMRKVVQLALDKYDRDFGGLKPGLIDMRLEAIKKEIPPERLLVFHPSEGWEPLCKFLGHPVPDIPFPKVNDGPSMVWILRAVSLTGVALWGGSIAISAGLLRWLYLHAF